MSEKPLDLKDFEIIGVKIPEKAWRVLVSGEKFNEERFRKYWKTTSDDENIYRNVIITQMIEICKESIRLTSKEIKQRIREACEFYLRYKNNPKSLIKEHPKYKEEMIKENSVTTCVSDGILFGELKLLEEEKEIIILRKYNEWLFKLAFRGVLER